MKTPYQKQKNTEKVSTLQSSVGSKVFSLVQDKEGNLYEVGYAEGTLSIQDQQETLLFPTLYVARSRWVKKRRKVDFISLFPDLVLAEEAGFYDISIETDTSCEGVQHIYVSGPFLGDRTDERVLEQSVGFFLHLNAKGSLVRDFLIEGQPPFSPLGLSGPFLFGNVQGSLRIRSRITGEIPVTNAVDSPQKAFLAKYDPSILDFAWIRILQSRSGGMTSLSSITSTTSHVYVGGSIQGTLVYTSPQGGPVYPTEICDTPRLPTVGLLVKVQASNGKLLWSRLLSRPNSTYLSLSVGGTGKESLFAVALLCATKKGRSKVILEKVGRHGASQNKVTVDKNPTSLLFRVLATEGRDCVFLLSHTIFNIYDTRLRLRSQERVCGIVGDNYMKPLTRRYLGTGARPNFSIGKFVTSRVPTTSNTPQSLVLSIP